MATIDNVRWHTVAALPVTALAERIANMIWRRRHPHRQGEDLTHDERDVAPPLSRPHPRPRLQRVAMARLLDADCQSCRGFGCEVCAGTGLV